MTVLDARSIAGRIATGIAGAGLGWQSTDGRTDGLTKTPQDSGEILAFWNARDETATRIDPLEAKQQLRRPQPPPRE